MLAHVLDLMVQYDLLRVRARRWREVADSAQGNEEAEEFALQLSYPDFDAAADLRPDLLAAVEAARADIGDSKIQALLDQVAADLAAHEGQTAKDDVVPLPRVELREALDKQWAAASPKS